jgi:hypothetical protein
LLHIVSSTQPVACADHAVVDFFLFKQKQKQNEKGSLRPEKAKNKTHTPHDKAFALIHLSKSISSYFSRPHGEVIALNRNYETKERRKRKIKRKTGET